VNRGILDRKRSDRRGLAHKRPQFRRHFLKQTVIVSFYVSPALPQRGAAEFAGTGIEGLNVVNKSWLALNARQKLAIQGRPKFLDSRAINLASDDS
jgi:hypothetical protein